MIVKTLCILAMSCGTACATLPDTSGTILPAGCERLISVVPNWPKNSLQCSTGPLFLQACTTLQPTSAVNIYCLAEDQHYWMMCKYWVPPPATMTKQSGLS